MNPLITTPGSATYEGLVELMAEHLSIPTVEAILSVVLRSRGLSPRRLQHEDLPEVVAKALHGLRLFCDVDRLPELKSALADYCDHGREEAVFVAG